MKPAKQSIFRGVKRKKGKTKTELVRLKVENKKHETLNTRTITSRFFFLESFPEYFY